MESHADAVWTGDLTSGEGVATLATGLCGQLPVSWASRTEAARGRTSPEELIAAAHAACFSMAFSHELSQAGHVPERLETGATCTFEQHGGGWRIASMHLTVRGRVPGCDEVTFDKLAQAAKDGCPVSRALAGNVEISLAATLEG
jgi:osmotically inducible protein OsmC